MNKISAIVAFLIGLYAFAKNNLFLLGGVTFIANPNITFKLAIPLAISVCGLLMLKIGKMKFPVLALLAVDLIFRAYELFGLYSISAAPRGPVVEGSVIVQISLWPLFILIIAELICLSLISIMVKMGQNNQRITSA